MYENNELLLDWDDEITTDGQQFVLLDEGDYDFTVTNFSRDRFKGSAKIPPCNKAVITLTVNTPQGTAVVTKDFIMARSLEWLIAGFFRCVGKKMYGENCKMDWEGCVGRSGRGHFAPRSYTNKDGETKQTNEVTKFYDPVDDRPDWLKEAQKAEEITWEQGAF